MGEDPRHLPRADNVGRHQIIRLTAAKTITNGSLRWIPFFFVSLQAAFDTSTATLAAIVGFAEMAGLSTLLIGKRLDDGHEKTVMVLAMAFVGIAGVVALGGSLPFFAVSATLLVLGTAYMTIGGHAWISARAPFERRARYIGTFEMSWAVGLLIGAPSMAVLIHWFGWRGPFVATAVIAPAGALMLFRMNETPPVSRRPETRSARATPPLTRDAWVVIIAAAAVAVAGFATLVVTGTWLDDDFGVSTGGIGLVAMAFGTAEFTASGSSALLADRVGKRLTTQLAMSLVIAGLAVMFVAGGSLPVGVCGLVLFFLGFEYGIVTSFSLVSEAMPSARGRCIAVSSATGTVARGLGAVGAGQLYDRFGVDGPIALSGGAATLALVMLAVSARTPTIPRAHATGT